MVKDHNLQLRYHPSLFHNSEQFNIEVGYTHYPVILKKTDKLSAMGATKTSTGGGVCGT